MAGGYSEVAQNDEDDHADIQSPFESLSPALSSSPMPFLPSVKSSFTPLSMEDSDLLPAIDRGGTDTDYQGAETGLDYEKGIAGTATTTENNHNHNHNRVTARATGALRRSSHHEYEPLAPNNGPNARSPSSSTDPKLSDPENTSAGLDSAVFRRREPGLNPKSPITLGGPWGGRGQSRNISSGIASPKHIPNSPTSRNDGDSQQPIVVKPKPLIRTASTKSVPLRHPTPEPNTRTPSYASNIAQLEATAERLSLTSSIEDAIRDLHEEQKRNESRRSSILAASIGSIPEADEHTPLSHQISGIGSILETNITARQGGYSPAAFVLSASTSRSNSTRLRSGSNPLSRPDSDAENLLTRHGPGKSSVRSVRSIKPTLTHIDEMEPPTTLTAAAMDAADKLPEVPDEDETLRIPPADDHDVTPNGHQYQDANALDYWDQAVADAQREAEYKRNKPPSPAGSTGSYKQTDMTFADFDGAHCSPDADFEDVPFGALDSQATRDGPWPQPHDQSRSAVPRPLAGTTDRPKSYLDPETGNAMLYYPARVPMMLNLPAKLSKKPKPEVRNVRRSKILDAMPEANRQAGAAWLPEYQPEPLDPFGSMPDPSSSQSPPEQGPEPLMLGPHHEQSETQPQPQSNITDAGEKRKSRMSLFDTSKQKSQNPNIDSLPPQLRASAFFDLPSEPSPTIELKGGSAMATLDSILDASAKAPVSAFTDHAFAGSLGAEVYGLDKKRRSHLKKASNATTNILEPKKRSSFLHLRKHSGLSRQSGSKEDRQETHEKTGPFQNAEGGDEERQHLSGSIDGEHAEEADDDEDGEEVVYNGPPTTLLAELQMRKQQQKMRTRPLTQTYPNGLHSTLLELDTVAEIERRTRKDKKVNLAWEGASADGVEDSEDEDTPLGLLMARKGHDNDAVALAELHRPPGLMEQKEMEENEPLSRRRNRLQGRENGPIQRQSMMSLNQGLGQAMNRNNAALRAPSPRLLVHTPEEDENEGETLGQRMRRLRAREEAEEVANALPRARPVSSSFSAELLGQLGDAFKSDDDDNDESKNNDKGKGKEKQNPPPPPEEETLGQRRRRLQAEREAAAAAGGSDNGGLNVGPPQPPKLTQRHSMADVLGASAGYNARKTMLSDPRADRDRARQEEAARYRADQDHKLAAFRSQIPTAAAAATGNNAGSGVMGGQQQRPRASMYAAAPGPGAGTGVRMNMRGGGGVGVGNGYPMVHHPGAAGAGYGAPMPMPMPMATGAVAGAAAAPPYAMAMPGQIQPPAPMDRVESWRQSVWP
ncbi:hypothetical protein SLS62_010200 [Diatrype stigma]|uniref:Uncharacterized protein n=1 Tax=Diatrype stigma TaxID=117547 RepID=A0AAN9YJ77_9PEZI